MKFLERVLSTPNIRKRDGRPSVNEKDGVVFHHTAGAYDGAVAWLMNPASEASAHVVIARDGRRTVLASDDAVTWHAGKSTYRGRTDCNAFMLGVEFALTVAEVHAGLPLSQEQIDSALEWLEPRWKKYGWTVEDMTDHRTVAPGRKTDLSPANHDLLMRAIAHRFLLPATQPHQPIVEPVSPTETTVVVPKGTRKVTILIEGD